MNEQLILGRLKHDFEQAKRRNPHLSLRGYARHIGLQPSALSELIGGKRTLSEKMAKRVLKGLRISDEEKKLLLHKENMHGETITLEQFSLIADWYYLAILNLTEIKGFKNSAKWVGERLGLPLETAHNALRILKKHGYLAKAENGKWISKIPRIKTPTGIRNSGLREHNRQVLKLAEDALEEVPLELRSFSASSVAIDLDRIEEIKEFIKKFHKQFCQKSEKGEKKEVYKLAIQFFPLSKFQKELS